MSLWEKKFPLVPSGLSPSDTAELAWLPLVRSLLLTKKKNLSCSIFSWTNFYTVIQLTFFSVLIGLITRNISLHNNFNPADGIVPASPEVNTSLFQSALREWRKSWGLALRTTRLCGQITWSAWDLLSADHGAEKPPQALAGGQGGW